METSLRTATLADLDALVALEQRCFEPELAFHRRELRYMLTAVSTRIILCVNTAGTLCGYGSVTLPKNRRMAHITSLATEAAFRNRGIGGKLFRALEELARQQSYRGILLEAQADSPALIAFYTSRGYSAAGCLPAYYPDGGDALQFVRVF